MIDIVVVVAGSVDRGLMCNAPAVLGGLTGSGGDPLRYHGFTTAMTPLSLSLAEHPQTGPLAGSASVRHVRRGNPKPRSGGGGATRVSRVQLLTSAVVIRSLGWGLGTVDEAKVEECTRLQEV